MKNKILPIPPIPGGSNPFFLVEIVKKVVSGAKKLINIVFGNSGIENEKELDEKNSSAEEVMKINSVLLEYREKVSKEAKQLEEDIKVICKEVFNQVLESVEFANSEFKFYRIESLERKVNRNLSEIDGIFEKHIAKKISMDNIECFNILKMLPGELKGQRMQELQKNVFGEAMDDLCTLIEDFQTDLVESMEMNVEDRLDSLEKSIQQQKDAFEKMSTKTYNIQEEKEKVVIESQFIFSIAKMELDALEV